MRINELISEDQQIDEGLGSMIGKGVGALAKGAGATVGGAVGAWNAAKQGYAAGKSAVAGTAPPTTPAAQSGGDVGSIMQAIDKLDQPTKQRLAGELEKSMASTPATPTAQPQGQSLDLDQLKKDQAAKQAAGQASQQQAQQQMATTQQANAATNQQDAAIKAAADAAKSKPPFQQTAADKLAIKAAADKGIKEAEEKKKKLKKKIVAEFSSNFLGMTI